MENWQEKYEALNTEFEQYKLEAVKWSVEDVKHRCGDNYTITDENAQLALEYMIHSHDANNGITWDTIDDCLEIYGEKIAE